MKVMWLFGILLIIVTLVGVIVWFPSSDRNFIYEKSSSPISNQTENQIKDRDEDMTENILPTQTETVEHYPDHFPKQLPPNARIPSGALIQSATIETNGQIMDATLPQSMYNYPFPKNLPKDAFIPAETNK